MNGTTRQTILTYVAALSVMGASSAIGHHSTAMYDYAKSQTLTGTVKAFQWTNPHMFIEVIAPDAKGNEMEWNIECGTPNINARHGWKKSDLKPGDKVTMEFHPMRDGTSAGTLMKVALSDGRVLYGPGNDISPAPGGGPGASSSPPTPAR